MSKFAINRLILIVCEGRETEYNYFVEFRNAHEALLRLHSTAVKVKRGRGGDAVSIVKHAISKAKEEQLNQNRGDRVYLLLDAEGPGNAPGKGRTPELPAAEKLATEKGIEIVYSCPPFEYWLLCHFEKISRGQFADCDAVIAALNKQWGKVSKAGYDKADLDIYNRLADRLDKARAQALAIDLHHINTIGSARRVNPSTQVYELIARLIGVNACAKCPLAGPWKLATDANLIMQLSKGDTMPAGNGKASHWFFVE